MMIFWEIAVPIVGLGVILLVMWLCFRSSPVPPAPDLGMRVGTDGNMLGVTWERQLASVRASKGGVLHIDDGAHHREIRLDPAQIANGLVLYRPASDDVTFRLTIQSASRPQLQGSVRWIDASGTAESVPSSTAMVKVVVSVAPGATRFAAGVHTRPASAVVTSAAVPETE